MNDRSAIVASGDPLTSDTAIQIMKQGGNAYDAIIAAGFVSVIAEPTLTSLGGGGFLLARTADGYAKIFDFFSNTPGKGHSAEALEPHFFPVTIHFANSDQDFNIGLGSIAVPGNLKGFLHVHKKLGLLPLKEVLAPAIDAARSGVRLGRDQADFIKLLKPIMTLTERGTQLYSQDGEYFTYGDILRNPDLANFLSELCHDEEHSFYHGALADRIEQEMQNGQGLLTKEDLESYQVIEREPLATLYRGRRFLTNPPPSFGGALIIDALHYLETYDLPTVGPFSPEFIHAHAAVMMEIENSRIHGGQENKTPKARVFTRGTTHISVIDREGNAAAMTTSNGEGSGYIIPDSGIMLNNMMGEDDLHPEGFHSAPPGERVSSMMSPSLLLENNEVALVIGSGGSKRIRTAITQVLSRIIDCGMEAQEAVESPRIHWDGEVFQVEPGLSDNAVEVIAQSGPLKLAAVKNVYFGGVHTVVPGKSGGADPRRGGAVRSYSFAKP